MWTTVDFSQLSFVSMRRQLDVYCFVARWIILLEFISTVLSVEFQRAQIQFHPSSHVFRRMLSCVLSIAKIAQYKCLYWVPSQHCNFWCNTLVGCSCKRFYLHVPSASPAPSGSESTSPTPSGSECACVSGSSHYLSYHYKMLCSLLLLCSLFAAPFLPGCCRAV